MDERHHKGARCLTYFQPYTNKDFNSYINFFLCAGGTKSDKAIKLVFLYYVKAFVAKCTLVWSKPDQQTKCGCLQFGLRVINTSLCKIVLSRHHRKMDFVATPLFVPTTQISNLKIGRCCLNWTQRDNMWSKKHWTFRTETFWNPHILIRKRV